MAQVRRGGLERHRVAQHPGGTDRRVGARRGQGGQDADPVAREQLAGVPVGQGQHGAGVDVRQQPGQPVRGPGLVDVLVLGDPPVVVGDGPAPLPVPDGFGDGLDRAFGGGVAGDAVAGG